MNTEATPSPAIAKAFDPESYYQFFKTLVEANKTSGNEQTRFLTDYTKKNFERHNNAYQNFELIPEITEQLRTISKPYTWVVLVESWCGDAAQSLPMLIKMAKQNHKIDLRILLRDENPGLMDRYLSNGARSIPKLIVYDAETQEEKFNWGPRPKELQELVMKLVQSEPKPHVNEKTRIVHEWYDKDRGLSLQKELLELIRTNLK